MTVHLLFRLESAEYDVPVVDAACFVIVSVTAIEIASTEIEASSLSLQFYQGQFFRNFHRFT